ncbi:MAG: hypothetical protein ACREQ7_06250, partial [Candidatus Binatia bacterium]
VHHEGHESHEVREKGFNNTFFLRALRALSGKSAPLRLNPQFEEKFLPRRHEDTKKNIGVLVP